MDGAWWRVRVAVKGLWNFLPASPIPHLSSQNPALMFQVRVFCFVLFSPWLSPLHASVSASERGIDQTFSESLLPHEGQ